MDFNSKAISSICERDENNAVHTFASDGSSTSYSQTSQGYSTPVPPASSVAPIYKHHDQDVQAESSDDGFCDDVAPAVDPLAKPRIQSQINLYRNSSNPQQVHRRNAATWVPTTQLQTAVAGAMPSNFQTANSGSVVSNERRSFNMDLINPIIESTLNTLVKNIVGSNNWSTITKGRRLTVGIVGFFNEKSDKISAKNQPSDEDILEICCKAIKCSISSIINTVVGIVEEVVALFEEAQWYLPRSREVQKSSVEAAFVGATVEEPSNKRPCGMNASTPTHQADKHPKSVGSVSSVTPVSKRQKHHCDSSSVQSLATSSSVTGSRSSGSECKDSLWICREKGCKRTKPFSSKKTFAAHYLTHFPFRVLGCPLKEGDAEFCPYMTERL